MAENSNRSRCETVEWRKDALKLQQEFYEKLGDRRWDLINCDERWALESKVAFAMFGEPKLEEKSKALAIKNIEPNFRDEDLKTYYEQGLLKGYTKQQIEMVKKICDKIYDTVNSKQILIAFLFVIGNTDKGCFIIPFFRVKKYPEGMVYFIDNVCRVYTDWDNYKKDNKLPAAKVLYPANGIYDANEEDEVYVEYAETPASSIGAKALAIGDTGVGVTSLILAGVGVASIFFPPAAPVAAAAAWASAGCGVYGASRGGYVLYDRSKHAESIGLTDSEARGCWISVVGSAFGVGSGLAMKGMVTAVSQGQVIGTAGKVLVNFLNFGSLTINGIGIVNQLAVLVEKGKNNELTAMDIFQFGTSVLFFTNSAMNAKTAATVIDQVQKDSLNNFTSDLSKRRMKAYNKLVNKSGGDGTMESRARIIKGITNVGSKDEFFRMTIRGQKQSSSTVLNEKGNLVVDGKAYVDTDPKLQTHVRNIPSSSNFNTVTTPSGWKKINEFQEPLSHLVKLIENICKENKKEFIELADGIKIRLKNLYNFLAELFRKYFFSNGRTRFPQNKIFDFIKSSEAVAQSKGCKTEKDFMDFSEFQCIYIKSKLNNEECRYQEERKKAMKLLGAAFDESKFALKWGIEDVDERDAHFLRKINDSITRSKVDLLEKFEMNEKDISSINEDGGLKFRTRYCAMKVYYQCFMIDGTELSPSEFFDLIRKVVNDGKSQIVIDDNSKYCTYCHEEAVVMVEETECERFLYSVQLLK